MHVYQSYSVSLCSCFGARTLHNINNLGLCIRVHVYNILFQYDLIIIIIIIMSLFKEDNIFSASTNLTYGPHKTWLNTYYLQTVKIYIYKIVQDTLKFDFKIFSD